MVLTFFTAASGPATAIDCPSGSVEVTEEVEFEFLDTLGATANDFHSSCFQKEQGVSIIASDVEFVGDDLGFGLSQNYPNPFNPSTNISFDLPSASHVSLIIYNVTGQRVRSLANSRLRAGNHVLTWDGMTSGGESVASGVYFCRLVVGEQQAVAKMLLLK
ncbi:MAG: T9SS type A sorting domain-containing protein [candidate division Zixibacteria bacterium]|nr:T9SS type A sorting domain-containing protein [candidate division Zixibacteria bacterium]